MQAIFVNRGCKGEFDLLRIPFSVHNPPTFRVEVVPKDDPRVEVHERKSGRAPFLVTAIEVWNYSSAPVSAYLMVEWPPEGPPKWRPTIGTDRPND